MRKLLQNLRGKFFIRRLQCNEGDLTSLKLINSARMYRESYGGKILSQTMIYIL